MHRPRLYFLDNLRFVVVILVIVLHAAIPYMTVPPSWWYVVDPQHDAFFTMLVLVIDVPLMLILFFISGYFAYGSLEKRGAEAFVRDKLKRIGLPWVFGVVFLAPPVTYLMYLSHGIDVPYLRFWAQDFWGPAYQQTVYWFLGILLALFVLLAIAYGGSPRWRHLERRPQPPGAGLLAGFWAVNTLWFYALSLAYPADAWANFGNLFMYQPQRALLYVTYFALGVYADRRGWFRPDGYRPGLALWPAAALLSGALYLAVRMGWVGLDEGSSRALIAVLFNAFCLSSLLAGTALFQRCANGGGRAWSSLALGAYGMYYVHPLILYPLGMVFAVATLSALLKWGILVVVTAALAWAFTALVLARTPYLRDIFGG